MRVSEVEPIYEPKNMISRELFDRSEIVTRDVLKKKVEIPCVPVVLSLYDKNIRTMGSDANQDSIKYGYACLSIDINSLSEENIKVLRIKYPRQFEQAINNPNKEELCFNFKVPLRKNSTVEEVSEAFLKLTEDFVEQDVLYGKWNMEDLLDQLICENVVTLNENETKEEAIQVIFRDREKIENFQYYGSLNGMEYFDFENNLIWATKELYDKHQEYLMTLEKRSSMQITPITISNLGKKEMERKQGKFSDLYDKVKKGLNKILNKDEKSREE